MYVVMSMVSAMVLIFLFVLYREIQYYIVQQEKKERILNENRLTAPENYIYLRAYRDGVQVKRMLENGKTEIAKPPFVKGGMYAISH